MFVTLYIAPPPTKKKNNLQVSETLLYWLFFSLSNTHPSSTGMHLGDLCSPQTLLSAQSSQILIFSSSATSHVLFLSTCSVFLFISLTFMATLTFLLLTLHFATSFLHLFHLFFFSLCTLHVP